MRKKWLRGGVLTAALALLCCLWAGAEAPTLVDCQGPIVRTSTEAFPIYSTAFSGPAPVWSDAAAFEDGVYEGYYAQLDGVAQLFYKGLQAALADPAALTTVKTVNVGTAAKPVNLPAYVINIPFPPG